MLVRFLVALSLITAAGTVGTAVLWRQLDGNITVQDLTARLGAHRPERLVAAETGPVNILVMGSDTRVGNEEYGRDVYGPPRSDTSILLHLSGDGSRAIGVSIPRDSLVDIPSCVRDDGTTSEPQPSTMFNEAFSTGGPACTIRTVEQLTGIRVDHHVVVDFTGFEGMVDALGGVDVCLPEAVTDPKARLDLPAGRQSVHGKDALAYVRSRTGFGDGSDLGRIGRQQVFLSSMVQKATSAGILLNPVRLVHFLDEATSSLTTDPGLASLNELRKLAQRVRGMDPSQVTFLTVPVHEAPQDPNRVVWTAPDADAVWDAVRHDRPVPGTRDATVAGTRDATVAGTRGSASPAPTLASRTADQDICG